jgi:glycosyltransferase involved in cell wall biosynthesis
MTENKNPLVSVIISVFNGEKYLAETIESVLNQHYPHIEIIIVNDGSTDGSGEVAQRFVPPVRYHCQSNSGIAAAWNKGIEIACGNFISFLDADDYWSNNKIQSQIDIISEDPTIDIVFGHVKQFHSPDLSDEEKWKIRCPDEHMPGVSAGTMLIKRETFYRVGLFNTKWRKGIFNDWYLRATETGLSTHMLPDVLMMRRLHRANHGTVNRDKSVDYVRALKASLDRRRSQASD